MSVRPVPEDNMTVDNLPDNMIHLGRTQFLVVRSYQGQTRIHVRKFVYDEMNQLIPTKDGVSLTPLVWTSFTEKLPVVLSKRYYERYPKNHVEVVERDLCIFKNTVTDGPVEKIEVMLQRMFKRRDGSFQLVPETVHLNESQCNVLLSSVLRVRKLIEVSLLTETLRHHVVKLVLEQSSPEVRLYTCRPYHTGLAETTESLHKCIFECITLKISEFAPCYMCDAVPCTCHTAEELLDLFFDSALYQ